MIFQRALRRELISTAGAVFTTLFTITITVMLIRILGQAANGRIASADVFALMGFAALNYLPVILILTGFISVLLVVTRSYQDSEMVVWFASGVSLARWIRPVLTFGVPIVLLTGLLSFYLTPWANRQSVEYRQRFEQREDVARVSPGRFMESSTGDRVFFVEGLTGDASKVKNVFVNTMSEGRNSVVVANEGGITIDENGDRFLILENGRRYDGMPTQPDFQLMEFGRYGLLVSRSDRSGAGNDKSAYLQPTEALLKEPSGSNLGEFLWRISLPFMCLALMLIAIPLGYVNPRGGRSANLLIALFMFVLYSNTVSIFQAAVTQNRLPFPVAVWPAHLAAFLMVGMLFAWRIKVNSRYHPSMVWRSMKRAWLFSRKEREQSNPA